MSSSFRQTTGIEGTKLPSQLSLFLLKWARGRGTDLVQGKSIDGAILAEWLWATPPVTDGVGARDLLASVLPETALTVISNL